MKAELETSPDSILMWNGVSLFVFNRSHFLSHNIHAWHGLPAYRLPVLQQKQPSMSANTASSMGFLLVFSNKSPLTTTIPQTKIHLIISVSQGHLSSIA